MATDIERLIETLVDDISCHGPQGCLISHVLDVVDGFYHADPAATLQDEHRQDVERNSSRQALWDWLRARGDVLVGKDRSYNHLPLSDVMAMPEEPASGGEAIATAPKTGSRRGNAKQPLLKLESASSYRPRVYVSEEQMWQSLAGHTADFKRVPRFEWEALIGIAKTREEGIIQGDLCRDIGQDKRSVPRRTDALAQKGYIVKRTTLVRGVKTSKMWLRRHAPSLPANPTLKTPGKTSQLVSSNLNLAPENLNKDIEPVPWRSRWTGKAIDMQSLAETVIAIVKAFGIIRYHDLRRKLGILTLPWQMKTTARFCRWMVRRGIVQYVGATLGDRLFKDCVKFIRDFTADDWADWLKTGKEKSRPKTDASLDAYRERSGTESERNGKGINIMIAWKPEKPLPNTVIDAIRTGSIKGVSNRYIGAHTMGPPFSRYITSVSTTLATPSLQPNHLAHFQVSKELQRVKKQSIYFFSVPGMRDAAVDPMGSVDGLAESAHVPLQTKQQLDQFFSPLVAREMESEPVSLTELSSMIQSRARLPMSKQALKSTDGRQLASVKPASGRIATSEGPQAQNLANDDASADRTDNLPRVLRQVTGGRGRHGKKTSTLILTFQVTAAKLTALLQPNNVDSPDQPDLAISAQPARRNLTPEIGSTTSDMPAVATPPLLDRDQSEKGPPGSEGSTRMSLSLDAAANHQAGQNSDHGKTDVGGTLPNASTKRGRPKGPAKKPRGGKRGGPFRCDKCGEVWRNDNGLKYHLEKSSSACNTSYVAPEPRAPGYSARKKSLAIEDSNLETDAPGVLQGRPVRKVANRKTVVESPEPTTPSGTRLTSQASVFQHAEPLNARQIQPREGPEHDHDSGPSFDSTTQTSTSTTLEQNGKPAVSWGHSKTSLLVESPFALVRDAGVGKPNTNPIQGRSPRRQSRVDPGLASSHGALPDTPAFAEDSQPSYLDPPMAQAPEEAIQQDQFKEERGRDVDFDPNLIPEASVSTGDNMMTPYTEQPSSYLPAFEMPLGPSPFGQRPNSQLHRSSEIIRYLLNNYGGCFPGEKAVWYALTAVWEKAFPSDSWPNFGTTQTVVKKMEEKKMLKRAVHAFRDAKGAFKSVTVLVAPGITSTSRAVLDWKDGMIAQYPETLILPELTPKSGMPDDNTWNGRPVFSTRRKLGQDVGVLTAPVYAVTPVRRRRGSGRPGPSPRKRQKVELARSQNQFHVSEEGPYDATIFRLIVGGHDSDLQSQAPRQQPAAMALTFLEPNSRLEDEEAIRLAEESMAQRRPRGRPPLRQHPPPTITYNTDGQPLGHAGLGFVDPVPLTATDNMWPRLDCSFFEQPVSYAMYGQLPGIQQNLFHCLPRGLADIMGPEWLRSQESMPLTTLDAFELQVKKCKAWERNRRRRTQLLNMNSVAPDYIWINHVVNIPVMEGVPNVSGWVTEDETTWNADLDESALSPRPKKRRAVAVIDTNKRVPFDPSLKALDFKTRKMTPWTGPSKNGQALAQGRQLNSSNNDALIAAFVATRVLLGGADKYVEWGLLLRLFPDKSIAWLRRFWSKARKDRAVSIANLTKRFQTQFVKAYERDELPSIDFDNILSYDWVRVVEWTMQLVGEAVTLPPSRAELQREFTVKTGISDPNDWQRAYYSAQSSMFSRLEALTSKVISVPVDSKPGRHGTEDAELLRAISWVRALCGTKPGRYNPADIRQKVSSLTPHGDEHNSALVARAIAVLQKRSVITKTRHRMGELGSHRYSDWFLPRLEKASHSHKFIEAATFKSVLDDIFRRNEVYRIPYVLQDGEVMAMINMQAFGRIKVAPVDVPHIPLGFKPGFYESRKFPKSFYNFGLEVTPTESYLYNEDMDFLNAAKDSRPPGESPEGALPLWSDIFGNPDEGRWEQVIRAMAFAVAMRGPLNVDGIRLALKPCLDDFEVRVAVDWATEHRILKLTDHGTSYTTDEWWWLLAGRIDTQAADATGNGRVG